MNFRWTVHVFFLSWAARANGVQWGTNVLFFYLFHWSLYHCSTLTARHRIVVSQRRAGKMHWARHTYLTHTLAPATVSPIFVVLFKRPFPCSRDKNNTSNLVIISLSWSWLSLVINRPERSRAWTSDLLSWWAYETFSLRTDPNVYFFLAQTLNPPRPWVFQIKMVAATETCEILWVSLHGSHSDTPLIIQALVLRGTRDPESKASSGKKKRAL